MEAVEGDELEHPARQRIDVDVGPRLHPNESPDESDDAFTLLDYLGSVDPELEALPDRMDLARAFGYLDEREKAIIYMYYYKGLSQTEIANEGLL